MSSTHQKESIEASISYFSEAKNITDFNYRIEKLETNSQNYFGELIPVVLTGKQNSQEIIYHLLLKLAPNEKQFRVSNAVTLFFSKEIFAYETILPKYAEILSNINMKDCIFPSCYFSCKDYCKEALLLQNMTAEGYKSLDVSFLDEAHVTESVKSLAYFHALSFILKYKNESLFKEISEFCVPINVNNNKRFIEVLEDRLEKAILKFGHTAYEKLFKHAKENCLKYLEMMSKNVNAIVICHGDMWKENILYKYEDQKPTSACLIDFQTIRIGSPAYDVLYLISSSTDSELRKKYYNDLLDTYYDIFENTLKSAGLDPINFYSKKMFHEDLKTVSWGCLIVVNTAQWLYNGMQQEGHVRSKKVPKTDEEKEEFERCYKSVIRNIVDDLRSYGYLDA